MVRQLFVIVAAGIISSAAFLCFLSHRSDYVGHYSAGFGGTLLALGIGVGLSPSVKAKFEFQVAGITISCIGLGALLEASIFQLAIFDPVDFCNQSLGAVVAGLAFLASSPSLPISGEFVRANSLIAASFLGIGFHWAFR